MRPLAGSLIGAAAGASEAGLSSLGGLAPSLAQGRVLEQRAHRPWALPSGPWLIAQTWEDLLFVHWRVPDQRLRSLMPPKIPLDTFGGSAWVGVTPFRLGAFRLRGTPHVAGLTAFAEVNVRTYATLDEKPGIFYLDAESPLAVTGARRAYRLPYFRADMEVSHDGSWIDYRSERVSEDGPPAKLALRYRPIAEPRPAEPGSLEYFLAERYCLYATDAQGTPHRADIHHPPWPLQPAEAEIEANTTAAPWGLELAAPDPLLHFAARQDVVIWPLGPV